MAAGYWRDVMSGGLPVPTDRPLDELTAELTSMLGSPDPALRDGLAYPALSTWIARGVYDDLLAGLGDGMATGLEVGLGGRGDDSVFRRAWSVRVLGDVLARDNEMRLLTADQVVRWGDRVATWLVREQDLRGWVPEKGWARALAHGADALAALAASPHLGAPEETVLLDVVADRLVLTQDQVPVDGSTDRLARATMAVLRRELVPFKVLEPWVARIAAHASPYGALGGPVGDPLARTAASQAFLRALHLQLLLAPEPPSVRSDLLLVVVAALRETNADHLL
ncbi:DUF2785 domain-containing protein [Nocardioides campestrisoli]|uniref:DUF2785 domain-containing protein n=1 Tax=Nocardioides campestrisoli TaxID=2736757 RepID=UPI00163D7D6B|nr:DUF2785 domain-containing protein [Nocardioides campestrisoli]